jgi:hypothetical protein
MIGNSLNTLDLTAAVIDTDFAYAASVWYDYNEFGLAWNDWEYHDGLAMRHGGAATFAREDRLSDLSKAHPENNSTFMSDGTLLFETGSLAPDVTVQKADVFIAAVDVGFKLRGLALNAEFYYRHLSKFESDGPLPITSMTDWASRPRWVTSCSAAGWRLMPGPR